MNNELIACVDIHAIEPGLIITPFLLAIVAGLFYASFYWKKFLGRYIVLGIQTILLCFSMLLLIGFINGIYLNHHNKPVAILNKNGLWMAHYGLIPWDNIKKCAIFTQSDTKFKFVAIHFKDISAARKHASLSAKIELFLTENSEDYHTTLGGLTASNDEIICLAKQFMQQ